MFVHNHTLLTFMLAAGLQSANAHLERDLSNRNSELDYLREQRTALEQVRADLQGSLAKEHARAEEAEARLAALKDRLDDTEKDKQDVQIELDKLRGGKLREGCSEIVGSGMIARQ